MVPWIVAGVVVLVVIVVAGVVLVRSLVLVEDADIAEWDEPDPTDWDQADGDVFATWPGAERV
jgi:hypothetical protein